MELSVLLDEYCTLQKLITSAFLSNLYQYDQLIETIG